MAKNKWVVHLKGRVFARAVKVETVNKKQAEKAALALYDDDEYKVVMVVVDDS